MSHLIKKDIMNSKEKAPGKIAGWIKSHKIVASCIAGVIALALVGGAVTYVVVTVQRISSEEAASKVMGAQWDSAEPAYIAAIEARDAALGAAEESRATGGENLADIKDVIAAASAMGLDVSTLTVIEENMNDALAGEFGNPDTEPKVYSVPDRRPELVRGDGIDFVTFTGKLEDGIRQFNEVTKEVEAETETIVAFSTALTGNQIYEAYFALAPDAANRAGEVGADASSLSVAIGNNKVVAKDIIDTLSAIAAKEEEAAAVVAPVPSPVTPNSGSGQGNGKSAGKSTGGGKKPSSPQPPAAPNQPAPQQPAPPPQPPAVQQPAPPPPAAPRPLSITGGAIEGVGPKCFAVGWASSTGGSVFTPAGVTNYTKVQNGGAWDVIWYSCP